jgi:hypothetical protein
MMVKLKIMNFSRIYYWIQKVLWAAFLVALPVTSFRFLPAELGGKTQVRPLSIYPLLILIVLVTIPRLIKKPLPITFLPLFAFVIAALVSSLFSLSLDLEAFKGVTMTSRIVRNVITLGIGVAIYLTSVLIHRDSDDLRFSLRWLYVGFVIVLLWGSFQAAYVIHYNGTYFGFLNKIQSLVSTQELYQTRISGLTYEPKWFAEQITFLLMPWLLAAVITKRSVFKWHYRWLSIELLLLVWSAIVLVFTFSRTGLFVLVLLTFVSVLLSRSFRKPHPLVGRLPVRRRWLRIIEATLAALVLTALLAFAGSKNTYFSRLWRYFSEGKAGSKTYLEYIAFGQRFAYAETAFRIFEDYPVLGVGLGNYAFFFDKKLPNRSWQNLPEIIRQVTPTERGNQLITPKNLYARLLAETGLVGTIVFTTFVIAVLGCSLYLFFSPLPEQRYWGLAGLFGIAVFATVVFSTDSFAIPNMWVVFGLITAAAHLPAWSERSQGVQSVTPLARLNPSSRLTVN